MSDSDNYTMKDLSGNFETYQEQDFTFGMDLETDVFDEFISWDTLKACAKEGGWSNMTCHRLINGLKSFGPPILVSNDGIYLGYLCHAALVAKKPFKLAREALRLQPTVGDKAFELFLHLLDTLKVKPGSTDAGWVDPVTRRSE